MNSKVGCVSVLFLTMRAYKLFILFYVLQIFWLINNMSNLLVPLEIV